MHIHLLLPFALHADMAPHTVLELTSTGSRDRYGEMPGAAALTSLGFLPLISLESWFHAGLCCHWTRGLITQHFTNWLSRYLQGCFSSSLTPGVSSDLLQGPVWKLCAPYTSLLPLVQYSPRHSSLCQAYLSMRHPCLHLNSFSCCLKFPVLFCLSPAFLSSMIRSYVFNVLLLHRSINRSWSRENDLLLLWIWIGLFLAWPSGMSIKTPFPCQIQLCLYREMSCTFQLTAVRAMGLKIWTETRAVIVILDRKLPTP